MINFSIYELQIKLNNIVILLNILSDLNKFHFHKSLGTILYGLFLPFLVLRFSSAATLADQ